jgi:uncharacterized OsmC-like protein
MNFLQKYKEKILAHISDYVLVRNKSHAGEPSRRLSPLDILALGIEGCLC